MTKDSMLELVKPISMNGLDRLPAIYDAIKDSMAVSGDYMECGIASGGITMMAADIILGSGTNKKLWLYDAFKGMLASDFTDEDVNLHGISAELRNASFVARGETWCLYQRNAAEKNINKIGYENIEIIEGNVLDTIPDRLPRKICCLCTDICMYKPSIHILKHAWDKIPSGGYLISVGYNWWKGEKKAVLETIGEEGYEMKIINVVTAVVKKK